MALPQGISHHELCFTNELVLLFLVNLHYFYDQRFVGHWSLRLEDVAREFELCKLKALQLFIVGHLFLLGDQGACFTKDLLV